MVVKLAVASADDAGRGNLAPESQGVYARADCEGCVCDCCAGNVLRSRGWGGRRKCHRIRAETRYPKGSACAAYRLPRMCGEACALISALAAALHSLVCMCVRASWQALTAGRLLLLLHIAARCPGARTPLMILANRNFLAACGVIVSSQTPPLGSGRTANNVCARVAVCDILAESDLG